MAGYAQKKAIVYFNPAESTLLPAARQTLDSLALALKNTGRYRLAIHGFCDSTGDHAGNVALGKARAMSVYHYLMDRGLSGDSMITKGFAESHPAAKGNDDASYAKNRRVEITMREAAGHQTKFDINTSIEDLMVGQKLVLKDLNFINDKAVLLPESVPTIKLLLQYMLDNPTLEIKLTGHVCCTDDMELSVMRAKFVNDYLVHNGVDPSRMTYEGLSNTDPLMPNDYKDQQAAKVNRRVEITIVNK
jgi:outer membrane protein OmpA-like peptidoglycan-associated protein